MRRVATTTAAGLVVLGLAGCGGAEGEQAGPPSVEDADPERGRELFQSNCAACHGEMAEGTTTGPPLVHEIYEPGHHSDEAFQIAVAQGTQQHHWDFGPMEPVDGLDPEDVADITAWVRQLQREAGIIE